MIQTFNWKSVVRDYNLHSNVPKPKKIINYLIGAIAALAIYLHSLITKTDYSQRYKDFWKEREVVQLPPKQPMEMAAEPPKLDLPQDREMVPTIGIVIDGGKEEAKLLVEPPPTISAAETSMVSGENESPPSSALPTSSNHLYGAKWAAAGLAAACGAYALWQTGLMGAGLRYFGPPSINTGAAVGTISQAIVPSFTTAAPAISIARIIQAAPPVVNAPVMPPAAPKTAPVLPPINSELQPGEIQIFTSYTRDNPERLSMSTKVKEHQQSYCKEKGYAYEAIEQNMAEDSLPYWSKIAGINRFLNEPSNKKWIVWVDDDAVIMNPSIRMEQFIKEHGGDHPKTHVIVTKDVPIAATKLNTGVLIVRNSDFSRRFFKKLWEKRHEPIPNEGYSYSNCPAQMCLHEQQAMDDLIQRNPTYLQSVKIIPQRDEKGVGLNTFERWDHFDVARQMDLNYRYIDTPESRCDHSKDYICQCTGLASQGRNHRYSQDPTRNLRAECIDTLIAKSSL